MQTHIGLKRSVVGLISFLFVGLVISVLSSAAHVGFAPDKQSKVGAHKKKIIRWATNPTIAVAAKESSVKANAESRSAIG